MFKRDKFYTVVQVYTIRDAAANNLKRLAEEFGPDWAMQHIIPQVCLVDVTIDCYYWVVKDSGYELQILIFILFCCTELRLKSNWSGTYLKSLS